MVPTGRVSVTSDADGAQQPAVALNNLPFSYLHNATLSVEKSAFSILMDLLTANGKIPTDHALDMLGEPDESLLTAVRESSQASFSSSTQLDATEMATAAENGEIAVTVWRNNLRRIFLRCAGEPPPNQRLLEPTIVGHCWISQLAFEDALSRAKLKIDKERALRACLDEVLYEEVTCGKLPKILDTLDDAVRHVESVCLYIEDEFFGVVERFTNLIGAGSKNDSSLFRELKSFPVDRWQPNHRLLVIALFALFASGRSVRFEEFSGKVLTARRLLARLDTLARNYCIEPRSALHEPHIVLTLAKRIGACALNTAPEGLLRYRYVNGVTFLKTERVIQEPNHDDSLVGISPRLCELFDRLCKGADRPSSARAFFTLIARRAIEAPDSELSSWFSAPPAKTAMEAVIQEIVASAVMAARADYGMSSSLRCPGVFLVEDA